MQKVRTTIRVERELHKMARRTALEQGKSFQELVEEGLKAIIPGVKKTTRRYIKIPGYHMGKIKGRLDRSSMYSDI